MIDEGSRSVRVVGESVAYFTYMGGLVTTESLPLDALVFDEVQQMSLSEIETAEQRLAASELALTLRVSTANFGTPTCCRRESGRARPRTSRPRSCGRSSTTGPRSTSRPPASVSAL
jgi:hypothetical protein